MKVLAISDKVLSQMEKPDFVQKQYADTELIISCGDLPAPYVDLIASLLNCPLFFVRGNHDLNYGPGRPGGDDLHRKILDFRGMSFAGLEGCPRYNRDPVQYTESEMLVMTLGLAPAMLLRRLRHGHGVDVMVTHSPPRGIHDLTDRPHQGFRSLRRLIQWYRPRYLLHGHVDTWDRRRPTVTQFAGTEVINVNPLKVLTLERRAPHGP
jgi:Icc-related predicted phosphoesterase